MKTTKPKLRPAEGWPAGWYVSGEADVVNLDALLAPNEYLNRVILGRKPMTNQVQSNWTKPLMCSNCHDHIPGDQYLYKVDGYLICDACWLKPLPEGTEDRQPDLAAAPHRESKA